MDNPQHKRLPPLILILLVLAAPLSAQAQRYATGIQSGREGQYSAGAMTVDTLFVRPTSLAATAVGTGVFIVSLPFSLLGRNVDTAAATLVGEPARYTFIRPLGKFRW